MSVREPPALEAPAGAGEELRCPVCLSLHRPGQRFCLECGATLADPSLPPDPTNRGAGLSRSRRLALALAALVLVIGGAAIAWAFTNDDDDEGTVRLLVAPPFVIELLPGTTPATPTTPTVPTDGGTVPTGPTDSFPTEPTEEIPTFSEPPATEEPFPTTEETFPEETETIAEEPTDEWPGGDGWAVILISKEVDQFDDAYMEELRSDAQSRGLSSLGILYSSNWSTLNPGFRVLYQGPFDSRAAADSAALAAQADGYDFAYPRRVAP